MVCCMNDVVFIDLKKAFDTIDNEILLQILGNYRIDAAGLKSPSENVCSMVKA